MPAAADHAEARCARRGEVLRGDTARRARSELPELVGFDHCRDLRRPRVEEDDHERRAAR
jgi:hypothetical protein